MWLRLTLAMILACIGAGSAGAETSTATLFGSVEAAFDGAYVTTGIDLPLPTVPGAVMRVTAGSGVSWLRPNPGYPFPALEVKQAGRLLFGWRESGAWGVATLFGGLAVEHRALPRGFLDPQTGTRLGPAMVLDAWLKPVERVSVQVYAELAMPYSIASFRVAPGYEVASGVFVGPEASIGLHHGTMRSRAGLHITGLRVWDVGLRLSGGYAVDRGGRGGAYGGLSLWRTY